MTRTNHQTTKLRHLQQNLILVLYSVCTSPTFFNFQNSFPCMGCSKTVRALWKLFHVCSFYLCAFMLVSALLEAVMLVLYDSTCFLDKSWSKPYLTSLEVLMVTAVMKGASQFVSQSVAYRGSWFMSSFQDFKKVIVVHSLFSSVSYVLRSPLEFCLAWKWVSYLQGDKTAKCSGWKWGRVLIAHT